jgi:hypothetical protein
MVGHKGRDYTVQYTPAKKAHRWGAKLWVLAESDTGYTLSIDLDFPLVKHLHYCLHVNTTKLSGIGHGALSW